MSQKDYTEMIEENRKTVWKWVEHCGKHNHPITQPNVFRVMAMYGDKRGGYRPAVQK
jgi:hypothetical protein